MMELKIAKAPAINETIARWPTAIGAMAKELPKIRTARMHRYVQPANIAAEYTAIKTGIDIA